MYLETCVAVISITSFQFGWSSGVINQPRLQIARDIPALKDNLLWGGFVAIFLLGGIIGGLSGAQLAAKHGRKDALVWNNVGFIFASLAMYLGNDIIWLYLARLVLGISSGIGTAVVPIYIAELSPCKQRGTYGSINQIMIVIGVLFSQLAGLFLSESWRCLLLMTIIAPMLQILLAPLLTETPYWLVASEKLDKARAALQRARSSPDIASEYRHIVESSNTTTEAQSMFETFRDSSIRRSLISVFMLQILQQASGINAATYYSASIFHLFFPNQYLLLSLLLSVSLLFVTVLSLIFIEAYGRRILLSISLLGMGIFGLLLGLSETLHFDKHVKVVALFLFTSSFGVGLGSIPWLILPELVPQIAIANASSVSTALNWGINGLVALISPVGIDEMGCSLFYVFAVICLFGVLFCATVLPETRGISMWEILNSNEYRPVIDVLDEEEDDELEF